MSRGRRMNPLGQKMGNQSRQVATVTQTKFSVSPDNFSHSGLRLLANSEFAKDLLFPVKLNQAPGAKMQRTVICNKDGYLTAQVKQFNIQNGRGETSDTYRNLAEAITAIPAVLVLLEKTRIAYQELGPPNTQTLQSGGGYRKLYGWKNTPFETRRLADAVMLLDTAEDDFRFDNIKPRPLENMHDTEWTMGLYGLEGLNFDQPTLQNMLNHRRDYGLLSGNWQDAADPHALLLSNPKAIYQRLKMTVSFLENPPARGTKSSKEYMANSWGITERVLKPLTYLFEDVYGKKPHEW